MLDERSMALGTVEDTETLKRLPLQLSSLKRDPGMYLETVPGYQSGAGFSQNINGGLGTYSELLVDGAPVDTNPAVHGSFRNGFSSEALAEFKVVNNSSADFGNTGGSVLSFVTRSGTNRFHGAGYWYLRNDALDSRSFFATEVATQKQNEFGFNVGGPIIIPKTYNGQNRTFFFLNMGKNIFRNAVAGSVLTFPTEAFKNGDFSALLGPQIGTDALGRPVLAGQIYDPSSTKSDGRGGLVRDPFPGNRIPSQRFSPVSVPGTL